MKSNPKLTAEVTARLVAHLTSTGEPRTYSTIVATTNDPEMYVQLKKILGESLFDQIHSKIKRVRDMIPPSIFDDRITLILPRQSKNMALNLTRQNPNQIYKLAFVLRAILEPGEFLTVRVDEHREFTAHLAGPEGPIVLNG